MLAKVTTVAYSGLKGQEVEVEVNIAEKGFPGFSIVGMSGKSGEEAKERIKTALLNSDVEFPNQKITVNLAPADLDKEGSMYDLPIAIGLLFAMGLVTFPKETCLFYGELSLEGTLRHTKGVFLAGLFAKEHKILKIFVPRLSANEACVLEGIQVYPVDSLKSIIRHLNGEKTIEALRNIETENLLIEQQPDFDLSEVMGQEHAKRALEIAASGGHNLLMMGPPGSGKTLLSRCLPGILPELSEKESLEVTKIYSITGNIPPGGSLVRIRPFRSPHHTTSQVGLIGGGSNLRPGEVSLAHRGVLFIDELPELSRSCLEALRQPIEDGQVSISRANGHVTFPAQFMLIAAANPCPCGYLGDPTRECKCSLMQISRYQKKLSGPILDRIDLHLSVPAVDVKKLMESSGQNGEVSMEVRSRVKQARNIQTKRFENSKLNSNSDMRNRDIKVFCKMEQDATNLLQQAVVKYALSARTYFRLIKVSRTIADLEGAENILLKHVAEALQYRVRSE